MQHAIVTGVNKELILRVTLNNASD